MGNFGDKAALSESLNMLHRYIRSMYISVDLPKEYVERLEGYFDTEDSARAAHFEKMIRAAAMNAIYSDSEIPRACKYKVAHRASEELVQAFRGAKVEYDYSTGKYGCGQKSAIIYEQKKVAIPLCRKATWIDRVKKNLPKQATKMAAKHGLKASLAGVGLSAGGPLGAALGFCCGLAVDAAWYLTPPQKKEAIKKKFGEMAEKAGKIVNAVSKQIKNNPVVQRAKQVVDTYIAPVVRPVYEKAKEVVTAVAHSAGNAIKKGWKVLKSWFA